MKRVPKYVGVQYYESASRKHNGKPDRCFYVTYKEGGKLHREKVGWISEGYSAETAATIRGERIRQIRHGEELPNRKAEYTFGDAWKEYDKWLTNGKLWPQDDRNRYSRHLKKLFEQKPFSSISSFDLEKLKARLTKDELAPATVKHVLILVRQVWNRAIKWGFTKLPCPLSDVKLPKITNRRERFLSQEEAAELLDFLKNADPVIYGAALISLMSGMRLGEIASLRWCDVDFESGVANIAPNKAGTIKRQGRPVYLNETVTNYLKTLHATTPIDHIFMDTVKTGIAKKISNRFRSIIVPLGFNDGVADRRDKVTFHTLRHSFASWLAISGTPLFTIKELMGHSSIAMTERYAKLMPDTKRDAVASLLLPQIRQSTPSVGGSSTGQDPTLRKVPSS